MADSCGNADPGARGAATTRALVQANTPPLLMNADPAEGLCVTRSRGAREITCAQANLVPATATREIDRVLSEVREQKRPGYLLIATWYRNILHRPQVSVQVGRRTIPVTAVPLTAEEGAEIFAQYAARHRAAATYLLPRLMGFSVDGSEGDFRAVGQQMPFVRLATRD